MLAGHAATFTSYLQESAPALFVFLSHRAELHPAALSSSSMDANQSQVLLELG